MTAPHVDLTLSPHVLPPHTHAEYAAADHTHTPDSIGAAAAAHTHPAADISPPPVITGSSAGAFAIAAGDGTDWYLTASANRTLTVAGGYDGQMIVVDVLASGGNRTVTVSEVTLTTGMTAGLDIPSGGVGTLGLRRTNGTWRLLAQTVDQ